MSSVRTPHGRLFQIRGPTAPKILISKAVVCTWHHTLVIRGRPKGSSVAFGDEMDSEMDTVHTDHVFICKQFLMHEYICCCDVCCCVAVYQQWTMKVTSSQTSCISRCWLNLLNIQTFAAKFVFSIGHCLMTFPVSVELLVSLTIELWHDKQWQWYILKLCDQFPWPLVTLTVVILAMMLISIKRICIKSVIQWLDIVQCVMYWYNESVCFHLFVLFGLWLTHRP